jgi:hypothetical protein
MERMRIEHGVRTKSKFEPTISLSADRDEHEAHRMAEAVRQQPKSQFSARREARLNPLQRLQQTGGNRASLRLLGSGQPLLAPERAFLESRFGHDFSQVRVHTDRQSGDLARAMHARAFTYGTDVYFGERQYAPATVSGQRLLAHELAHVIQQQSGAKIQRQEIPSELLHSADLSSMSEEDLQRRHDLILSTLSLFDHSTPETVLLEEQLGSIGVELGRRRALAAGRTFSPDAIDRMRAHFIANAKSATRAGLARVIEFEDTRGRVTTGTLFPHKLHESVWDAVLAMSGGDPGWSVFGLSLMDGNHSVTLTLDNNDPKQPRMYWSDQWSTKGGWKEYARATLDAEITRLTQKWWNEEPQELKPKTRTTLWRLNR